jgi:RHS repeat-associated protein
LAFDVLGRLTSHQQITDGEIYSTSYEYNLSGALIEETYPSGRKVKNVLNNDGELSIVQSAKCLDGTPATNGTCTTQAGVWNYAQHVTRDTSGAVTKMQLGNGRWETAAYNNRQQITEIGLGTTDTTQNLLRLELDYGTNTQNNGSLREQKITVPTVGGTPGFTAVQTYTYDDLNRIQSATEMIGQTETWKQTFTIDRYGNRRFNTGTGLTTTLGSCTEEVCNPTISTATNRFTSTGYDYDENGNVTQDAEGRDFLYDAENHQTEVKDDQDNIIGEYLYDGEGRRVKKISNTETTIFVYNAGGTLVAEYSTVVASSEDAQVSYLTTDHLGSPRVITNDNGEVTSRKDYTAFGEETLSSERDPLLGYSGADEIRKGYTGYEKDDESGLDFAQARYYNSVHGRYTSIDPLTASASIRNPQTFNRYSYVLNSPYKYTDPLGLLPVTSAACAQWCNNRNEGDVGRGGGGRPGYDDPAKNFLQQQAEQAEPPPPTNEDSVGDPQLRFTTVDVFVDKDPDENEPDSTTDATDINSTDPKTNNVVVDVPPFTGTPTVYVVATVVLDGDGSIVETDPRGSGSLEPSQTGVEANTRQTPEGSAAPRGKRWDLVETLKLRDSENNPQSQRVVIAADGKSAQITFAVQLLGPDFKRNNSFTLTAHRVSNQVLGTNGKINEMRVTTTRMNVEFRIKYREFRLTP